MEVSSERILRDLWVLKYHPKTIQERLQKVKSMGVETLYPWMVRCTEQILNRQVICCYFSLYFDIGIVNSLLCGNC